MAIGQRRRALLRCAHILSRSSPFATASRLRHYSVSTSTVKFDSASALFSSWEIPRQRWWTSHLMRTTGLLALAQSERGECIPANFFDLYKFSTGFMVALMSPHGLDSENSSEQVKEKVDLLREVIRRVQEGEDVDVEGLLGTGDEVKEKEWEKVVEELQAEEKSRKMPSEKTRNPASEGSEHRT